MRLVDAKMDMHVMKKTIYAMESNVQRMKTANSKTHIIVNTEFVIDLDQQFLNKGFLNNKTLKLINFS
jgi:hypothetical protein